MSVREVERFYRRVEKDEFLKLIFRFIDKNQKNMIKNKKDLLCVIESKIIPIAKSYGYNFTAADLIFYETKILRLRYKKIKD